MTRWIIAIVVGLLILCEMLFSVPDLFAQDPGGPYEQLSPGNQKAVRALFEAQRPDPPRGTRPMTLDEIAAQKQGGQGWGRVFDGMRSRGLVDAKNFGQVVSSYNHRHQIPSHGTSHGQITSGANRTSNVRGDAGGRPVQGGQDRRISSDTRGNGGRDRSQGISTSPDTSGQGRASASLAGARSQGGGSGVSGASTSGSMNGGGVRSQGQGHGQGRGK
jgi:hypothetical protein